jgi:hypothetical protein
MFDKCVELSLAMFDPSFKGRCQHFAFAVYKKRILAIGRNSLKTSPLNLLNRKISRFGVDFSRIGGTCAEHNCLRRVKNTTNIPFDKIALYVVRINRKGEVANSRPCTGCQSLLRFLGVNNVFYTATDGVWTLYGNSAK